MQVVKCTNAKTEYEYTRYWREELDEATLRSVLYKNATQGKNRHYNLHTVGNKNGRGITYYDITCGFDCETYTDVDKEIGYMYIWQMCLNGVVIKGRTYEEFITLLDDCKHILQPKNNHRLLCFVHNLSYEFSWFRSWLNLDDPKENFLKEVRQPIKLTHEHFVEFRDSMALVGGDSLAGLAKKYTNTQKCKGDLDYSIPRNRFTKLTTEADYGDGVPREEEYCDNDVLILHEFARWVFDDLMNTYHKLPMTQTGMLTKECEQMLKDTRGKRLEDWYKMNVERCPENGDVYDIQSNFLYRGGFVHCCVDIVEEVLCDLMGVDITSSYPFCMTQKLYPKKFVKVGTVTADRVNDDIEKGNVAIFIAEFTNIKSTGLHSIESKSKCLKIGTKCIIDNGRVYYAESMTVYITSFDWQNYQHFYKWDSVKITAYEVSEPRYMYAHIVTPMLKYYREKAELKLQKKPYAIQKAKVNSFYGMCKAS